MSSGGWRRVFRLNVGERHVERDVNSEIAFHIDMRTRKLVALGMDPGEAARQAVVQFGDVPGVRDEMLTIDHQRERAMQWSDRMAAMRQDVRYALRALRAQPAFTLAVVLILAIGIGANTSIFTVVDALMLRSLPVPHAEQLVSIGNPASVNEAWTGSPAIDYVSYPVYADLRDKNTVLSGLYATGGSTTLDVVLPGGVDGDAHAVDHPHGRLVSGNFFSVLGVRAALGRTFTAEEDRVPLGDPVAVISYGYWQRRFGGDRAIVGTRITIDKTAFTIVGVTGPEFVGDIVGQRCEVWLPMMMQPAIRGQHSLLADRRSSWLLMMGRLAPGETLAHARAVLTTLEEQSLRMDLSGVQVTRFNEDLAVTPVRIEAGARGFSAYRAVYGSALGVLMVAVGLVVLIICANVANLMLARATARTREMTVRLALGAGRGRLIQQLLTESVVVAAIAGALGLAAAFWGSRVLLSIAGDGSNPIPVDISPDTRVLAFTSAITLVSAMLFGLLPALRATRVDVATALRAQGRSLSGARGRFGRFAAGKALVVTQVALSTLMLIGTGLLARSMQQILTADLGFDRSRLVMVGVQAARSGYEGERRGALMRDLAQRARQVPGVLAVSFAENGTFSGGESAGHVTVPGFVAQADSESAVVSDAAGPDYFRTIGAHLLRGRDFDEHDVGQGGRVAVINETMMKRYFGAQDPIGRVVVLDSIPHTVVGVVRDVQEQDVRAKPVREMYVALFQRDYFPRNFMLMTRTAGAPSELVAQLRTAILASDRNLTFDVTPVDDMVGASVAQDVLVTRVVTFFGLLALLLAALGLYGVTAYATSQRTSELGLRAALGAEPGGVMRMIVGEAIGLATIGVALGLPVGLLATRLIRGRLFGVGPIDGPSIAAAIAVLIATAAIASYLPARRAARVGPLEALRAD